MNPQFSNTIEAVDTVFIFILGISAVMLLGITAAIVWFAIRYSRKRCPVPLSQKDSNLTLEIVWTVIPTILVLAMFYYGWAGFLALRQVPEGALPVEVTARMWSFTFSYENGKTSDRLVVPVGKPVKVTMKSEDVLHAFFVPAFRVKRDIVPGMVTHAWFSAPEPGSYDLFCAEFCGVGHADMVTKVEALPEAEFNQWYAQAPQPTADGGTELLTRNGCLGCHALDASVKVGPGLQGLYGSKVTVLRNGAEATITRDEGYLRKAVVDPGSEIVKGFPAIMPPYTNLSEEELEAMVKHLKGL